MGIDPGQLGGAASDFIEGYLDLKSKDDGRFDKFYHCVSNCRAAQRGVDGEQAARKLSDFKENLDQRIKNDFKKTCDEDQRANQRGRDFGRTNPGSSCTDGCADFLIVYDPAVKEAPRWRHDE